MIRGAVGYACWHDGRFEGWSRLRRWAQVVAAAVLTAAGAVSGAGEVTGNAGYFYDPFKTEAVETDDAQRLPQRKRTAREWDPAKPARHRRRDRVRYCVDGYFDALDACETFQWDTIPYDGCRARARERFGPGCALR